MKYFLIVILFFTSNCFSQEVRDAKTLEISGDTLFLTNLTTGVRTQITKTVPTQVGQSGKFLSTNGTVYVWATVPTPTKSDVGLSNVDNTSDANKPVSSATTTALNLKANIAAPAFTGAVTTTGSIGYATGAGGTITQATSKATGVTLNKITGDITMNGAALAAATIVSFTLTNSTIAATDQILVQHQTTGTFGAYNITGRTANGSAIISIRNNTAASLSEAIVIKFTIIKSTIN